MYLSQSLSQLLPKDRETQVLSIPGIKGICKSTRNHHCMYPMVQGKSIPTVELSDKKGVSELYGTVGQDGFCGLKELDITHPVVPTISESTVSLHVVYAVCSGRKL